MHVRETATRLRRNVILVAESDLNDARVLLSSERGGYGIRAQCSDDFHHSLHALLTKETQGYYRDFGKTADLIKQRRGLTVAPLSFVVLQKKKAQTGVSSKGAAVPASAAM